MAFSLKRLNDVRTTFYQDSRSPVSYVLGQDETTDPYSYWPFSCLHPKDRHSFSYFYHPGFPMPLSASLDKSVYYYLYEKAFSIQEENLNVAFLMDENQKQLAHLTFDSFGNALTPQLKENEFGYLAQLHHTPAALVFSSTGLYDPQLGVSYIPETPVAKALIDPVVVVEPTEEPIVMEPIEPEITILPVEEPVVETPVAPAPIPPVVINTEPTINEDVLADDSDDTETFFEKSSGKQEFWPDKYPVIVHDAPGFLVDKENNELIIFGEKNSKKHWLSLEDYSAFLQKGSSDNVSFSLSLMKNGSSLEGIYSDAVQKNGFEKTFSEALYLLQSLIHRYDFAKKQPFFPQLADYPSLLEQYANKHYKNMVTASFCIKPKKITIYESQNEKLFFIADVEMEITTSSTDPIAQNFAAFLTSHFDEIATKHAAFAKLKTLTKLLALNYQLEKQHCLNPAFALNSNTNKAPELFPIFERSQSYLEKAVLESTSESCIWNGQKTKKKVNKTLLNNTVTLNTPSGIYLDISDKIVNVSKQTAADTLTDTIKQNKKANQKAFAFLAPDTQKSCRAVVISLK